MPAWALAVLTNMSSRWLSSHRNACHSRAHTVKSSSAGRGGDCQPLSSRPPERPHPLLLTLSLVITCQTHSYRRMGACWRAYHRPCRCNHTQKHQGCAQQADGSRGRHKGMSSGQTSLKSTDCAHISQLALKLWYFLHGADPKQDEIYVHGELIHQE